MTLSINLDDLVLERLDLRESVTHLTFQVYFKVEAGNPDFIIFQTNTHLSEIQQKREGKKNEGTYKLKNSSFKTAVSPLVHFQVHMFCTKLILYREILIDNVKVLDQISVSIKEISSRALGASMTHEIVQTTKSKFKDRLEYSVRTESNIRIPRMQLLQISALRAEIRQLKLATKEIEVLLFKHLRFSLVSQHGETYSTIQVEDLKGIDHKFEFVDGMTVVAQCMDKLRLPITESPIDKSANLFYLNIYLEEFVFLREQRQSFVLAQIEIDPNKIQLTDFLQYMKIDVNVELPPALIEIVELSRFVETEPNTDENFLKDIALVLALFHSTEDIARADGRRNHPFQQFILSCDYCGKTKKAKSNLKSLKGIQSRYQGSAHQILKVSDDIKDLKLQLSFLVQKTSPQFQGTNPYKRNDEPLIDRTRDWVENNVFNYKFATFLKNNQIADSFKQQSGFMYIMPIELTISSSQQYIVQYSINDFEKMPHLEQGQFVLPEMKRTLIKMKKYNDNVDFGVTLPYCYGLTFPNAVKRIFSKIKPNFNDLVQLGFHQLTVRPHLRNDDYFKALNSGYAFKRNLPTYTASYDVLAEWLSSQSMHIHVYDAKTLELVGVGKVELNLILADLKHSFLRQTDLLFEVQLTKQEVKVGKMIFIACGLDMLASLTKEMIGNDQLGAEFNMGDGEDMADRLEREEKMQQEAIQQQIMQDLKPETHLSAFHSRPHSLADWSCLQYGPDGRVLVKPEMGKQGKYEKKIQNVKNQFSLEGDENRFYRDYQVQERPFDTDAASVQELQFQIEDVKQQIIQARRLIQIKPGSTKPPDAFLQQQLTVARRYWLEWQMNQAFDGCSNYAALIDKMSSSNTPEILARSIAQICADSDKMNDFASEIIRRNEALVCEKERKLGVSSQISGNEIIVRQVERNQSNQQVKIKQTQQAPLKFSAELQKELELAQQRLKGQK